MTIRQHGRVCVSGLSIVSLIAIQGAAYARTAEPTATTVGVAPPATAPASLGPPPSTGPVTLAPPAAPTTQASQVVIPEGTEIEVEIGEQLSSGTNSDGDRFTIITIEPMKLANGVVIPAGYRGKGTVTHAERRKFIGKAGELTVTFDYIRFGADRVRVRANKGGTGKGSLGSAVALTVLFGPLGLLARGANLVIPKGQQMTVYVDDDKTIAVPVAPPPLDDE